MPEKIVHNLTTWRDEIELALVFWFIGATIGIGQSARERYRHHKRLRIK